MFAHTSFSDHECLKYLFDRQSGMRAIVAVHDTTLGPAAGGCRLWTYASTDQAASDAMRLSQGMTRKNAMAGLPFGGGKAVILGPLPSDKRQAVFRAFGEAVQSLNGIYVTAEDVGVGVADMKIVSSRTKYVSGIGAGLGTVGGDPSPYTARGVLRGIEAAVEHKFQRSDLEGLKIGVQGIGGVGYNLCKELHGAGAKLVVSDIDPNAATRAREEFDAQICDSAEILYCDADIVAPCALGAVITEKTASRISAKIVAGGANNQLVNSGAGDMLAKRGILYAPDYMINAGGIIMVAAEYRRETDRDRVLSAVDDIRLKSADLFARSNACEIPTHILADQLADSIVSQARQK